MHNKSWNAGNLSLGTHFPVAYNLWVWQQLSLIVLPEIQPINTAFTFQFWSRILLPLSVLFRCGSSANRGFDRWISFKSNSISEDKRQQSAARMARILGRYLLVLLLLLPTTILFVGQRKLTNLFGGVLFTSTWQQTLSEHISHKYKLCYTVLKMFFHHFSHCNCLPKQDLMLLLHYLQTVRLFNKYSVTVVSLSLSTSHYRLLLVTLDTMVTTRKRIEWADRA